MEVSPKTLREVEFREKRLGGYHPDDVDEFLERVAVGIEVYQEKLRQANDRINHLERQLAEASKQVAQTPSKSAATPVLPSQPASRETEEALKRTLMLAQRTADMAVAEAKQEASEISNKARVEARSIVDGAREAARKLASEAERDVQNRLRELDNTKVALESHVSRLKKFVETEHARLRQGLADAQRFLDESAAGVARAPIPSGPASPIGANAPLQSPADSEAQAAPPSMRGSAREAVREMLLATGSTPAVVSSAGDPASGGAGVALEQSPESSPSNGGQSQIANSGLPEGNVVGALPLIPDES